MFSSVILTVLLAQFNLAAPAPWGVITKSWIDSQEKPVEMFVFDAPKDSETIPNPRFGSF